MKYERNSLEKEMMQKLFAVSTLLLGILSNFLKPMMIKNCSIISKKFSDILATSKKKTLKVKIIVPMFVKSDAK